MRIRTAVTFLLVATTVAPASSMFAQAAVAVRELSAPEAKTTDHFGTILSVRPMAGGKILINDGRSRQLVALDGNLANRSVIIDSVAVGGQSYGPRATPLIPYLADSSLFVDGASLSLLVISPTGAIARVMSAPKPNDLRFLASSASGVDARGNLVYRGVVQRPPNTSTDQASQFKSMMTPPDSLPIVRANFETRTVDTIGRVKGSGDVRVGVVTTDNRTVLTMYSNPLSNIDEWAVLSDGTVAIVRGHDYHVDMLRPDGKIVSSAKLPFDWKRLSDGDKIALIDSAKKVREDQRAAAKAAVAAGSGGRGMVAGVSTEAAHGEVFAVRKKEDVGGAPAGPAPNPISMKEDWVAPSEIVDYWPPIRAGATKADLDGNVWVLPTTSAQSKNGELIYDVVSNRGVLSHRVRVPLGRSIAGFGHGGVVYLMYKDGDAGWMLERTRVVYGSRATQ